MNDHPLGELLVEKGLVAQPELADALADQARTGRSLGRILIERGAITSEDLVAVLAGQIGLQYVDLAEVNIDPTAAALVPDKVARRYQALPIGWEDDKLVVAMADPSNVLAVDDIRSITGADLTTVVATRDAIIEALERVHRIDEEAADVEAMFTEDEIDEDLSSIKEVTEEAPIVKLANMIIVQAVSERASDIHVEPTERDVRIRYRVDGVLHEMMRSPKRVQSGLVSRLKIMADINIAERRVPQDGRLTANINGKQIDLRVATLPTVYGEKVVMRILDTSQALLTLPDLGFLPTNLTRFESAYRKPYGAILVTGPTGSGKSTTLYATLNALNDPAKNIITVEDPVEYRLAGINQVQVNNKAGLSFASALRSILRADPDVLLVGEIRDRETAMIAAEAALTGHLVLSTLHTNDAASSAIRLVEMGVEPFLVSSAVDCIVAQRLARLLCDRCKEPYQPTEAELAGLGWDVDEDAWEGIELQRAVGCQACGRTGYRGRFAIHEVLLVSEEIERMIAEREHSEDIQKVAVAQGMLTLRQAGLAQVRAGLTSIEELLRVVA